MKTDFVQNINTKNAKIPAKLKSALNKFFKKNEFIADGCILLKDFDRAPFALVIESSALYEELNYGGGDWIYDARALGLKVEPWGVHTEFHNAFKNSGYAPEMINSCVVGFYKD